MRHRRVTAVLQSDPAVSAVVAQTPEFQQAGERIVELIEGPEPSPLRRVTVSMMLGGIYYATTDPRIAEVGDAELHRALVVCARPLMVGPPAVG